MDDQPDESATPAHERRVPDEPVIDDIFETGRLAGRDGRWQQLRGSISREEGWFLFDLIQGDPTIGQTLEVGCGQGISSLHICAGLRKRPGALHTIIDPWQRVPRPGSLTPWEGTGALALERQGHGNHRLIEDRSELALPKILEQGEGRFDLVFIDGWHTFDHTLLDSFYATRLLRVDGVLAIHDVWHPGVSRAVEFLMNYPCYEQVAGAPRPVGRNQPVAEPSLLRRKLSQVRKLIKIPSRRRGDSRRAGTTAFLRSGWPAGTFQSLAVLRKTKDDRRRHDWHVDFRSRLPMRL